MDDQLTQPDCLWHGELKTKIEAMEDRMAKAEEKQEATSKRIDRFMLVLIGTFAASCASLVIQVAR